MTKIRDIMLLTVLALFLAGPALMGLAKGAGVSLPEDLDPSTADYLAGGRSNVELADMLTPGAFFDGSLQDGMDDAVSGSIPAKAPVLFANAGLQRLAIQASNLLYGWPCHQTYYGSEYLLDTERDALVQAPYTGLEMASGLEEFATAANAYAASHPELQVDLLLVDRACTSESNPASSLVAGPFTTQMAVDAMDGVLTEDNIRARSLCYQEPGDFLSDFYRSDHHWNVNGVLHGMQALYGDLAEDDVVRACMEKVAAAGTRMVDGPTFSGSCVRNGLYEVEDDPMDFAYNFDDVAIKTYDGEEFPASVHGVYDQTSELNRHYQFYDMYYKGGVEMHGPGQDGALLVSDSFGSAFQWPLAECHSTLWTSNNLHYDARSDARLDELCDLPSCSRIVFVGCVLNFSNFLERNPNAFD